jgi:hypothetical protein
MENGVVEGMEVILSLMVMSHFTGALLSVLC